jgi:haloacetate dehalogenase
VANTVGLACAAVARRFVGRGYDPLAVWRQYGTGVRGQALPADYLLPEEASDPVSAALHEFLD